MTGPAFCRLATRISAYQSVMRHRLSEAAEALSDAPVTAIPPAAGTAQFTQQRGDVTFVPSTREAISADPVLAGLFSFG